MTTIRQLYNASFTKASVTTFTTAGVATVQDQVRRLMNAPTALFVAKKDFDKFIAQGGESTKTFEDYLDVNNLKATVDAGFHGNLFGMPLFSDACFPPEKQFIADTYVGIIPSDALNDLTIEE